MKGVEIGDGFEVVKLRGSENRDEITKAGFQSNHAGGILGGISSGQQIVANIALKPTSITVPGHTINRFGEEVEMITKGRHDPCVGIRAVPIAEAMLAIVLMDHHASARAEWRRDDDNSTLVTMKTPLSHCLRCWLAPVARRHAMAENNPTDRRQRPVNRRVFQWLYRWRRGAP